MPITEAASATWTEFALVLLEKGSDSDQQAILDVIGNHEGLTPIDADKLLPRTTELLLDPDPRVRYSARKARDKLDQQISPQRRAADSASEAKTDAESSHLTRRDILLKKMRLGSRYVAFEAINRLIESGDSTLADPMLEFLNKETDLFKISFLVKRLPKIPDQRIPAALEPFLRHHDPRVVANTLEGLSLCHLPHLHDEFVRLAGSPDNRVKASAITALYAYEPLLAERRIQEMLENPSIAMQDSGVYLLRVLRPPRLNTLLEIPLSSRFPTIRLLALEINKHPPSFDLPEQVETGTPLTAHYADKGLVTSLSVATLLVMLTTYFSGMQSLLVLIILGAALTSTTKNRPSSMLRAVISTCIIACALWGDGRLIVIPALLAIWHPVQQGDINRLPRIAAWLFALTAGIISQSIVGLNAELTQIATRMGVVISGPIGDLQAVATQDARFAGFIFATIAAGCYIMLHINEWYSSAYSQDGNKRRLVILFCIAFVAVILLNLGRSLNLRFNLATIGIGEPAQLLRRSGK